MIKLLDKIGRFSSVAIITTIAILASIAVTAAAVTLLNGQGFEIRFNVAIAFAACVPMAVAPPISWFLVSLILRIYQVEEKMRHLASYDSLTGLLTRHAFFASANHYVSLATRQQTVFSVIIIDLDHFKQVNDQHGHPAGDAVLRLFADVLNSVARRSDITGRMGGEEFAVVLPSTTAPEAIDFSERLHVAINKAVLKYNDVIIKYTVSIGLTSFEPGSDDTMEDLLARADLALYQAKRAGRNQTSTFNPEIKQVVAS